jgi:hypothetical protein
MVTPLSCSGHLHNCNFSRAFSSCWSITWFAIPAATRRRRYAVLHFRLRIGRDGGGRGDRRISNCALGCGSVYQLTQSVAAGRNRFCTASGLGPLKNHALTNGLSRRDKRRAKAIQPQISFPRATHRLAWSPPGSLKTSYYGRFRRSGRGGRVEEGRLAGTYRQPAVSLPRSSNRTCPFRASGFPTDFTN